MKKYYKIITLGCKVNQSESRAIAESLNKKGWHEAMGRDKVDLCIINTCTVTHKASKQSRQTIRHAIKEFPKAKIICTGCYAQMRPHDLEKIHGLHNIIGQSHKHMIPSFADILFSEDEKFPRIIKGDIDSRFHEISTISKGSRTRTFLKIQDGCNAFCTYCIVPYARGKSRSMNPDNVLDNMKKLKRAGYREVVLSGIHIGLYGRDLAPETSFTEILKRINEIRPVERVRISSVEPHELSSDIIDLVADSDIFCHHFHIPLQSGDAKILKRMGRPYSPDDFFKLITKIHKKIPDAAIGVDTLIGFPGESHEAFYNTFNIIKNLPVSYLHVFPFSPRKGTAAYDYPGRVPIDIIKQRCKIMRDLGMSKKKEFYKKFAGKIMPALIESERDKKSGMLKGLTSNYLTVLTKGDDTLKNKIVPVKIREL